MALPQLGRTGTPGHDAAGGRADLPGGLALRVLFGRPLLVSEACQVVGTPGDLVLCDPLAILTATRPGEVREDLSLHCWFDLDLSAFRFTMRLGAVPWWASTVVQKNGGATVSTAVVLEAR